MSRHVSTHALERAINQLSTGGVLALDARRSLAGYDQLQEIALQFQVPISGTASSGVGWTTIQIPFDVQFVFAPEQRDSPLAVPHFTSGVVVSGAPQSTASEEARVIAAQAVLDAATTELERTDAAAAIATAQSAFELAAQQDQNNPASLVAVFVQVVDWGRDLGADAIIGAEVGIGVSTVGGGSIDFDGYVHLTFQGYAAPSDTPATVPDQQLSDPRMS